MGKASRSKNAERIAKRKEVAKLESMALNVAVLPKANRVAMALKDSESYSETLTAIAVRSSC